jgi:hypothetical protein
MTKIKFEISINLIEINKIYNKYNNNTFDNYSNK